MYTKYLYTFFVYNIVKVFLEGSDMTFSENLRAELVQKKMPQAQLALEIKTTQQTVSRWVQGVNQPDYETLFKICKILDVTPNELLGWED